jgi:hypothetical protein
MPAYDFGSSAPVQTASGRKETVATTLDLRGLDLTTPVDLLKNGKTPYAKNFRLYAQQSDDRRVAISSRKGPGFYTNPVTETLSNSNTASTGASTAKVGIITGQHLIPFTAASNERISKIEISVYDVDSSSGPLMVQIYSDDSGPKDLLSESSILGGSIGPTAAYLTARFNKSPLLSSGATYWIVIKQQDDATGQYTLTTTTAGTKAWKTDSTLSQAIEQTYAFNYRVYTSPDATDKGAYRFARDNGENITLVAYGTTMYYIDEVTNSFIPIISGLSALAETYNFTNADNKVFWVNSYDELTAWNGIHESLAVNSITNPGAEVNTTTWTAKAGTTLTRTTSEFNTGVASFSMTAASGTRGMNTPVNLLSNHRYKITYWAKGASGNTQFEINATGTPVSASVKPLTTGWSKYEMYYTPGVDVTTLEIQSTAANFFVDDISIIDTGIEYIIDTELPILSDIVFHKDRPFGVVAADKNKIVFGENPGNPSNLPVRQQWYNQWLSISFIYVPRPHNGSPITKMVSFQDSLTVFTQDKKYIISGYDRGSFNQRESTGSKGTLSNRSVAVDENFIYFVSDDGFYKFNGSSDKKISNFVSPLFDGCGQKQEISPVVWKNQVKFYMASRGSSVNDIALVYDKELDEMMLDTDTYVNRAIYYSDADDDHQLVEFSSQIAIANLAEQQYNSLGAPIDFEYRMQYNSMKAPGQKKRIKRFIPLIPGVDNSFDIVVAMDKDFQDAPKEKILSLSVNGALIGSFDFGDGTLFGGDRSFKNRKLSYSGYAYYWQPRIKRKGVNNRVAFIGAQFSYKTKRL